MKSFVAKAFFNTSAMSLFVASLIATLSLAWQVHQVETTNNGSAVVLDPPEAVHADLIPGADIEKVNVEFEVGSSVTPVPTSYYEFPPYYVTVGPRCDLPEYRKN